MFCCEFLTKSRDAHTTDTPDNVYAVVDPILLGLDVVKLVVLGKQTLEKDLMGVKHVCRLMLSMKTYVSSAQKQAREDPIGQELKLAIFDLSKAMKNTMAVASKLPLFVGSANVKADALESKLNELKCYSHIFFAVT